MTASCENTCKRLDDYAQVSLQNLKEDMAHISYAHVHHGFMVMNIHGPHGQVATTVLPSTAQERATSSWAAFSPPQ
jgi:hypothetical protein